jgi:hypothetical protein
LVSVSEAQASFEKEDGSLSSDVVMPPAGVGPGRYKGDYSLGVAQLHWLVLQELRSLGHPVVEVSEVTILGGWLSGPVYLQGSGELSGWDDAWNDHREMNRKFEVADLSKAQLLVLVKEYLGRAGV